MAQGTLTPLSYLGFGDAFMAGSAREVAMGGLGSGTSHVNNLSTFNPADYASVNRPAGNLWIVGENLEINTNGNGNYSQSNGILNPVNCLQRLNGTINIPLRNFTIPQKSIEVKVKDAFLKKVLNGKRAISLNPQSYDHGLVLSTQPYAYTRYAWEFEDFNILNQVSGTGYIHRLQLGYGLKWIRVFNSNFRVSSGIKSFYDFGDINKEYRVYSNGGQQYYLTEEYRTINNLGYGYGVRLWYEWEKIKAGAAVAQESRISRSHTPNVPVWADRATYSTITNLVQSSNFSNVTLSDTSLSNPTNLPTYTHYSVFLQSDPPHHSSLENIDQRWSWLVSAGVSLYDWSMYTDPLYNNDSIYADSSIRWFVGVEVEPIQRISNLGFRLSYFQQSPVINSIDFAPDITHGIGLGFFTPFPEEIFTLQGSIMASITDYGEGQPISQQINYLYSVGLTLKWIR